MSYKIERSKGHGMGFLFKLQATSWTHLGDAMKDFFDAYPNSSTVETKVTVHGSDGNGNIIAWGNVSSKIMGDDL